jgi:HAE1 family hydrophobic/amphiphilic exporter-1
VKGNAMLFIGTPTTPSEGIKAQFTGENEERDKNFRYLVYSMLIGVILIFGILVTQFNSFRQSAVVMITVPLSFIGVVLGMWACGFPFSLASFIGLVSLTGIVVNDAIVLVEFTNQARKRGLPLREAIVEAGVNRLRPVLLTTITTIGGLLPLLLNISGGAEFWQPLTAAVVFGLAFATVLTLVVIPVCYSVAYSVPSAAAAVLVRLGLKRTPAT